MTTLHQNIRGARQTKQFRSKTPAFRGCPQKKGYIIRLDIIKPKKPNSAKRKTAKIRIMRKGKATDLIAYIPGQGTNLQTLAQVLVRGGRVPDCPGVRYHIFRHKLDFQMGETFQRSSRRSKYGIPKPTKPTET